MSKYIKVFDTVEEYNNYSGSTGFVTPNISYVKGNDKSYYDDNEIKHYTPESWININNETGTGLYPVIEYITSAKIPNNIKQIKYGAFQEFKNLTSVNIPSGVTDIENQAFMNCNSLTSINFPSGVRNIGNYSFYRCFSLTSIDIPSGVIFIGLGAFGNCTSLTSIIINNINPPTLGNMVFDSTNNCPIYVPASSVDAYKAATNWSAYSDRIQAIPNN